MTENDVRFKIGDIVVIKRKIWGKLTASQLPDPQDRMFRIDLIGGLDRVSDPSDRQYFGTWQKNCLSDAVEGVICESWISIKETKDIQKGE